MSEGDRLYDLAIIGGGVNGCGIARDAAGRGARVLLLERGDLAQGTSSASTKLIHGGLRYLEHYEFGLVRQALGERERLWSIAPHIIWPMRFVLPYAEGLRPRWLLRLGLLLYDHIGGRKRLPATETLDLETHIAGRALKPGFRHGYVYSDGWVDDARLVVLNARDAADHGATIATRSEVVGLEPAGELWRIKVQRDDKEISYQAKAVVNAAGPSAVALLGRTKQPTSRRMRLVRGSHIVVRRLFDHDYAYFFQLADKRIFFVIPYERDYTLIGTTDRDHDDEADKVEASPEEIDYLCAGANQYLRQKITPADVLWTFSGIRPLIDDGSGKPEAATRGYDFELSAGKGTPPLLSVFGGKITTYRHLAAEAVARLSPLLPVLSGQDWTATAPLPGGDFGIESLSEFEQAYVSDYPFMEPGWIDRIIKAYGTHARNWLGSAASLDALGTHFGHGLTAAEVDYLMEREWARTAQDVLWRRTKLGLRLDSTQAAALEAHMAARRGAG